ncbi:sugar-transfer associated ATP-grasp domain-containing protein [Phytoactinopolyspora endophytica]|uniref:sugar-transfer associated ATP-grasp domain-containing protein n=1 Tax=Phytoactinopolyspora endophytica TaxID=1642495 RepID=UPI00101C8C5E|nr:sugar-transfer associated ATP-grasp domain-containing protein [Phytoactinopolyspora endophytica]
MGKVLTKAAWARGRARVAARRVRKLPKRTRQRYRAGQLRLTAIRKLVKKEREWEAPLRMRRPRWWLKGFLSRSAILYDLDHNDPAEYVSDLQRVYRTKRMVHERLQDVINNKLTTHLLLGTMDIRSAKLLGVYWRQAIHCFPGEERVELPEYLDRIEPERQVFLKVLSGAEGKNIFAVKRLDESRWSVNGEEMDLDRTVEVFYAQKRPLIVEEGLEQHPKQSALYPDTVNTIRVLTMIDVNDGHRPFIAMAVQRIGTRSSEPADNWSRGGLSARVELDTGQLGRATRLPLRDEVEWFDAHPDTGSPITGVEVPYWPQIRDLVLHSARVLSFMEYVGWDIVVTPDGPVVLEANINTGMNVLQAHQPLFTDPRARAYYAERGVMTDLALEPPAVDIEEPI